MASDIGSGAVGAHPRHHHAHHHIDGSSAHNAERRPARVSPRQNRDIGPYAGSEAHIGTADVACRCLVTVTDVIGVCECRSLGAWADVDEGGVEGAVAASGGHDGHFADGGDDSRLVVIGSASQWARSIPTAWSRTCPVEARTFAADTTNSLLTCQCMTESASPLLIWRDASDIDQVRRKPRPRPAFLPQRNSALPGPQPSQPRRARFTPKIVADLVGPHSVAAHSRWSPYRPRMTAKGRGRSAAKPPPAAGPGSDESSRWSTSG
jgi:hypothetical protein